jgi:Mu-like prophage FluMu protein gp28
MQLAERAADKFGTYRVEGVKFSGPVKEELAYPFRAAFEDLNIRIPNDPKLRADLRAIKKETTAAGNIRFSADRGENGHSDRFWAGALAIHAKGGNDGPCRMALPEKETDGTPSFSRMPLRPDHRSDRKISLNERTDW